MSRRRVKNIAITYFLGRAGMRGWKCLDCTESKFLIGGPGEGGAVRVFVRLYLHRLVRHRTVGFFDPEIGTLTSGFEVTPIVVINPKGN